MRGFVLKMMMVGVLAVLLVVAGSMVRGVVTDRIMNRDVARSSIGAGLAGSQRLAGMLLRVEYSERWQQPVFDKDGKLLRHDAREQKHEQLILPEFLKLDGTLISDPRRRGIFHINAYVMSGKLAGEWKIPALDALERTRRDSDVQIDAATAVLAVSDPRGLRKIEFSSGGEPVAMEAGSALAAAGNGAHAVLPGAGSLAGRSLPFVLKLELAGTDAFSMVPLGRETSASLTSQWPHPSFGGRFLPENRTVSEGGFEAQWHVSALASNARQIWQEGLRAGRVVQGDADAFAVSLIDPVDVYSMSDRATKYAELFIALTLGAFLLFELLRRLNLHPMNYLLIGAALLIFFLLLLSLSEQLGFGLAYLTASGACVLLIGFYSAHLLRSLWLASGFTLGLGLMYGALYMILLSEQNALLMGSLLLFLLLAAVMVGTRKVDWNALLAVRTEPVPEEA